MLRMSCLFLLLFLLPLRADFGDAAGSNPVLEVVRLLLDAGADPNMRDGRGNTPFWLSSERNPNPEIALLLRGEPPEGVPADTPR